MLGGFSNFTGLPLGEMGPERCQGRSVLGGELAVIAGPCHALDEELAVIAGPFR